MCKIAKPGRLQVDSLLVRQLGLDVSGVQATFEDELVEDALAKRHSLTCEAVQIGAKVRLYAMLPAHCLLGLLTHFVMQHFSSRDHCCGKSTDV